MIVDISHEKLDKIFQYRVPDVLRMQIHPGTAVTVPFGNGNRRIQGYVVKLTDRTDYPPEKIKEIQGVCAGQTGVEGKLIALAAWMRDYYGSTMIQALKAVLPSGVPPFVAAAFVCCCRKKKHGKCCRFWKRKIRKPGQDF